MLYYTVGQWKVFIAMIPAGFAAGAWYGLVEAACRLMKPGLVLRAFCDIVIAAGAWLAVVAGVIAACYGEMRLYAFLGAVFGVILERVTLGKGMSLLYGFVVKIWRNLRGRQEKARLVTK